MDIEQNLFCFIFNHKRKGLRHIGEQICKNLDYRSIVNFKRSSKLVYIFLQNVFVEDDIFREKLHQDWQAGDPKQFNISFDLSPTCAVTNVKLINEGEDLLVSIAKNIYQYNFTNKTVPNLPQAVSERLSDLSKLSGINTKNPSRVFKNENENLEKNKITNFDLLGHLLIAGNHNGILSIWDLETTYLLNSKQLFGIITEVRCREEESIIVTSHIGKDFGFGCISVRKMVSPTELCVVWSAHQDVMPIFNFDMNHKYLVTLEWLGTLNMIHIGSASVYNRGDNYTRRGFSEGRAIDSSWSAVGLINNLARHKNRRFTSSGIFKDDYVALGTDDGADGNHTLSIWDLTTLTMIHAFRAHMTGIFQIQTSGDRLISRDKDGNIIFWDTRLAADTKYVDNEENLVLMRMLTLPYKDKVLCMDMDLRRLAVGKLGGVVMLDFWDSAKIANKTDGHI